MTIHSLSRESLEELQRMLRWFNARRPDLSAETPLLQSQVRVMIFKTPSGGIPAAAGNTPGSAECELWDFDPETGDLTARLDAQGAPVTLTVFNTFGSAAGTTQGTLIHAKEHVSGRLLVDAEDCTA